MTEATLRGAHLAGLVCLVALAADRPAAAATKVACVGEQSTHSAHNTYPNEYPAKLQELLGKDYEVQNFGQPKGTVLYGEVGKQSTPYGTSKELADSKAFAPDIVVIGPWGMHDSYPENWTAVGSEFGRDLERLTKEYLGLPSKPRVLLALPLAWEAGGHRFNTLGVEPIQKMVEITKEVAAKLGLSIVDLWTGFAGKRDHFASDSFHTVEKGKLLHAELVKAAILALPESEGAPAGGSSPQVDGGAGERASNDASGAPEAETPETKTADAAAPGVGTGPGVGASPGVSGGEPLPKTSPPRSAAPPAAAASDDGARGDSVVPVREGAAGCSHAGPSSGGAAPVLAGLLFGLAWAARRRFPRRAPSRREPTCSVD